MLGKSLYLKPIAASHIGALRQTRNFSWAFFAKVQISLSNINMLDDKPLLNAVTALMNYLFLKEKFRNYRSGFSKRGDTGNKTRSANCQLTGDIFVMVYFKEYIICSSSSI